MSSLAYSPLRIWLHWLSAAVIIWTLVSGFYVAIADVSLRIGQWVAFVNVSLTTVFIPFFVWRLFMYVVDVRQTTLKTLALQEKIVLIAHTLIYLVICIVLVTGVLMMGRPIDVFGVVEIAQPLSDPALISGFRTIHVGTCAALSLLILLHIGAVIFHESRGHRILQRMALFGCHPIERPE